MSNIADFIKENCSTIGTGALVLTGPVDGSSAKFSNAWNVSTLVDYAILDGLNRETGMGTFNGSNQLSRDTVLTTLENGVYTDSGATPITLQGQAVVACALNAKAIQDIATGAVNAIDVIYNSGPDLISSAINVQNALEDHANAIDDNVTNVENLDFDINYREMAITSMQTGGELLPVGNNVISVTGGSGEIIDSYTSTETQTSKEVTWDTNPAFDVLAAGGMPVVTGFGYTSVGISKSTDGDGVGSVSLYPNGISMAQRRDVIVLGYFEYVNRVITAVVFSPIVSNQVGNVLMDWVEYSNFEDRTRGLLVRPTEIGNLTIWRDSGQLFEVGINYKNALNNQNILDVPARGSVSVPISFIPVIYNNGTTATETETTIIDSGQFEEDGDGLGNIGNGKAVIHYILQSTSGNFYMSYGQKEYDDYEIAKASLFPDRSGHMFPAEMNDLILLAQVVVLEDAAAWGLTAEVFPLGASTSSGSGGGTATSAINISYTDTNNLGTNVQVAIDSLAAHDVDVDGKADKIVPASAGNIATLDATGNLADGGALANNIAYVANPATIDNIATLNADGSYKDSGIPITDAVATVVTDNLTSISATDALSANQGRVLNDGKLDVGAVNYMRAVNPEVVTGTILETVYNLTGTVIDPTNGSIQVKTLASNEVFTTANFLAGHYITLRVVNLGSYTITWPTMRWIGGVDPVLTTEDVFVLWKDNDSLYGSYIGSL